MEVKQNAVEAFETAQDDTLPRMSAGRILCSHLVDVWTSEPGGSPEKAVLEEMDSLDAAVAVERRYQVGDRVLVETGRDGPVIPAEVTACQERETDRVIRLEFRDGYRWRLEDWPPDHGVRLTNRSDGAAAG